MALCKRLIARLDIKGNRLIKGIRFEGLRVLGDPCEAALRYANAGADELLYIDAVASLYGRNGLADVLRRTSREVFIPITAGGGVRSVADAAALLAAGADKIAVNTAALQRPELITELAQAFGSQCVVASIQARCTARGVWEAMGEAGRERSGRDVFDWIDQVHQLGAGEILLTSVDNDGTCGGPDQDLQAAASIKTPLPIVLGGGYTSSVDVFSALQETKVSAVSVGAALHHGRLSFDILKKQAEDSTHSYDVRPLARADLHSSKNNLESLSNLSVGIVDYGMGNQQSLCNALQYLGAKVVISDQTHILQSCDLLILPGVGAFPRGIMELIDRGLDNFLRSWVAAGRPLLGICLGMQMLFESSEEFSLTSGLGLLSGRVVSLPTVDLNNQPILLPHIGWNLLRSKPENKIDTTCDNTYQYFVHSFVATDVEESALKFESTYLGHSFVAAVKSGCVAGFQFHPERSGPHGLFLLAKMCKELVD